MTKIFQGILFADLFICRLYILIFIPSCKYLTGPVRAGTEGQIESAELHKNEWAKNCAIS